MDERSRHDRTVRLLETHLEALAAACERAPGGARQYEREITAAVAATRHAIALALISTGEADAIWALAARRHPAVRWCGDWPPLAA